MQYISATEAIKRLAAAQGIDVLNLVKTEQQIAQEAQAAQQEQRDQQVQQQISDIMKSPAAAQIAKNYTEKGSTYGPQFPLGSNPGDPTAVANVLPDAQAAGEGLPSGAIPTP